MWDTADSLMKSDYFESVENLQILPEVGYSLRGCLGVKHQASVLSANPSVTVCEKDVRGVQTDSCHRSLASDICSCTVLQRVCMTPFFDRLSI